MAFVLLGAAKFAGTRQADVNSDSNADPLPQWCFMLLLYYIGISYTFSGICKLCYSGLSWGDGSSLMMWVEADAINRDNLVFQLLTSHHWLASILQTTTLIAEVISNIFLDTYILIICFLVPEYRIHGHQFFRELLSGGQTRLFSSANDE